MLNGKQHHRCRCSSSETTAQAAGNMLRGSLQPIARLSRLRSHKHILLQAQQSAQLSTAASAAEQASKANQQWSQESSIYYSNYPLDRAAEARRDEIQIMTWFNAPNSRFTPVNGSRILVTRKEPPLPTVSDSSENSSNGHHSGNSSSTTVTQQHATYQPVWVSPASELTCSLNPSVPPLFLGLDYTTKTPHFAVQVAPADTESLAAHYNATWISARNAGPELSPTDAAVMAVASGLAQWNLDAQYHGTTGAATAPANGGFSRKCSSSGRSLYPRVDPAIITLVTAGQDWCLLGRKHEWPKGRYSTLAGFLEIGETLEQALAREVLEESGVTVDLHSVRYVASQPWPFPRSLMVAFYAAAAAVQPSSSGSNEQGVIESLPHQARMAMLDSGIRPTEVADALAGMQYLQRPRPQEGEMEDVRWFHRDWLRWALQQGPEAAPEGFMIPGTYSLAHKLITEWLQQQQHPVTPGAAGTNTSSASSSWSGDLVPQVEIDKGVFKYVLLRLTDAATGRSKLLVRGAAAAAYHNHILQHTKAQVQQLAPHGALQVDVLGGGRMEHYAEQKVISVYGYSAAFGPAVHEVTVALLRRWYPLYDSDGISCSYDGY